MRELRNRIHIKTLSEAEYNSYTPTDVNHALDAVEEFRIVAMKWTVAKRTDEHSRSLAADLAQRAGEKVVVIQERFEV